MLYEVITCHIIERLRERYPGSMILRTLGRQYAGEERPRWSLGLYQRRDARVLADGLPTDPLGTTCACDADMISTFFV